MNPTCVVPEVNVETERWIPVVGYEGLYSVSNLGRVKSHHHHNGAGECVLRPGIISRYGHLRVRLCAEGRIRQMLVHRLVLEAFVGPRPAGCECRHLDGNPANNRLDNLCWGTRTENMSDRDRHGTTARGERCGRAKLTEANVHEIRKLLEQGMPQRKIGRLYGVSGVAIAKIKLGKTWAH